MTILLTIESCFLCVLPAYAETVQTVSISSADALQSFFAQIEPDITYKVRLTSNIALTDKLSAIPGGATVNLDMNNKSISWSYVGNIGLWESEEVGVLADSYTEGSFYEGRLWGLFTNYGTFNITGSGSITLSRILDEGDTSAKDNYVQRLCTIVNAGELTLGKDVTVNAYLTGNETGTYFHDTHLYCVGIYNEGGVLNTAGTIHVGSMAVAYVGGINSFVYTFDTGVFGGTVHMTDGLICVESYCGGYKHSLLCKESSRFNSYAVGIYSDDALVTGNAVIETKTSSWMGMDSKDCWGDNGYNIELSVGILYNNMHYPVIGSEVTIDSSYQFLVDAGTTITVPGFDKNYTNLFTGDPVANYARCAQAVAGISDNSKIYYATGQSADGVVLTRECNDMDIWINNGSESDNNRYVVAPSMRYIPESVYDEFGRNVPEQLIVDCSDLRVITYYAMANETFHSRLAKPLVVEDNCGENIFWRLENGKLTVTGTGAIPEAPSWQKYNPYIREVEISDGITVISDNCFSGAYILKNITLPDSLEVIGDYAFKDCNGIINIMLPKRLNRIGIAAFDRCAALANIYFSSGKVTLEESAFAHCVSLVNVIIPDGVSEIPNQCFSECRSLSNIYIPSSVKKIGSYAFHSCKLSSVVFAENSTLETIEPGAFYDPNLKEITLPKSLKNAERSFDSGLKTISFEEGTTRIPDYIAYYCSSLECVNLPESVTEIGSYAFAQSKLQSLLLLEQVTTIGESALPTNADFVLYCYPGSAAETYAIENEITYASPAKDSMLEVCVYDDNQNQITTGYSVVWYQQGTKIATGNTLYSVDTDSTYTFDIVLGAELSKLYRAPVRQTAHPDGSGVVIVTLDRIPSVTITGTVVDAAGKGIANAKIDFIQIVSSEVSSEVSVTTDANGMYSASVLVLPTTQTVSCDGYKTKKTANFSDVYSDEKEITVQPVVLHEIIGNRVAFSLQQKNAARVGDKATYSSIDSFENLDFSVYNVTQDKYIENYSLQFPYICFEDNIHANDQIKFTISNKYGSTSPAEVECVLDENCSASVTALFVQSGMFVMSAISAKNETLAIIYDAEGLYVKTVFEDNDSLCATLPSGQYTVVVLEDNDIITRTSSLAILSELGLKEGVDYIALSISVQEGIVTDIDPISVPVFDSSKYCYFDMERTELSASLQSMIQGKITTLKVSFDVKDEYEAANGEEYTVKFAIPDGVEFIENSVTVNGRAHSYSKDGNIISVPVEKNGSTIRCCVSPIEAGSYIIDSIVCYNYDAVKVIQNVGSVAIECENMALNVPEKTSNRRIMVSGQALSNATVRVYDGDAQIGTVKANKNGLWGATVELVSSENYTYHKIYVVVETSQGLEITSEIKTVYYDVATIEIESITMINTAHPSGTLRTCEFVTVVDYQNPSNKKLVYNYWPNYPTFTFKVQLTVDDPKLVDSVDVITLDRNGRETKVTCLFDPNSKTWVGTHNYTSASVKPVSLYGNVKAASDLRRTLTATFLSSATDISSDASDVCLSRYYYSDLHYFGNIGLFGYGWLTVLDSNVQFYNQNGNEFAIVNYLNHLLLLEKKGDIYEPLTSSSVSGSLQDGIFYLNGADSTFMSFNSDGKIASIRNIDGTEITFEYNNGELSRFGSGDHYVSLTYEDGKIISANDGADTVFYTYNGDYLVCATRGSNCIEYEYCTGVLDRSMNALNRISDNNGNVTDFCFDSCGRLISVADNGITTTYDYIEDYTVKITDSEGNYCIYEYDETGALQSKTGMNDVTESILYTDTQKVSSIVCGEKTICSYTYNKDGNINSVTDASGSNIFYEYDDNSNLTRIIDAQGYDMFYEYDDKGNIIAIVYPDGSSEEFTYTEDGNISLEKKRNGDEAFYNYTSAGKIDSITYSDGSVIKYIYDDNGLLVKIYENGNLTSFNYDSAGNIISIVYPDLKTVSYSYDERGNRNSVTDSEGYTTNYVYYDDGSVWKVLNNTGDVLVEYEYNSIGAVTCQKNSNGTYTEYTYADGFLSEVVNYGVDSTVLSQFSYTYDAQGNVKTMTDSTGTWRYKYDDLAQLIETIAPDNTTTEYVYDKNGNRIKVTVDGESESYTVNDLNQYTSVGDSTLTYNLNGSLSSVNGPDTQTSYKYDYKGRLIKVVQDGVTYEYTYDVFGNRNSVSVDGKKTEYVYSPLDDGLLLTSYASDGSSRSYIQANGLSATVCDNSIYYYNYNMLGSTSEITDASGLTVNAYLYDAEGRVTQKQEGIDNTFTYVGKYGIESDANGLYYIRDRYVNSATLSFISVDDNRQTYDLNMYRYANNNPSTYVDTSGDVIIAAAILACAAVGATVGVGAQLVSDTVKYAATGKWQGSVSKYVGAAAGGAVGGVITGMTGGLSGAAAVVAGVASGATSSFVKSTVTNACDCAFDDNEKMDWSGILIDTAVGGMFGAVGKYLTLQIPYLSSNPLLKNNAMWQNAKGLAYPTVMGDYEAILELIYECGFANVYKNLGSEVAKTVAANILADYIAKLGVNLTEDMVKSLLKSVFGIDDPSGYVYEAVPSNRIEGVTATLYYLDEYEDDFGVIHKDTIEWDATEFDQENPLVTNEYGQYGWDVPTGKWMVEYEKDGYITTQSDWLDVPPPQTEVNICMVSTESPTVESVVAYDEYIEIKFSQYMQMDTIDCITVSQNGSELEGTMIAYNAEDNGNGVSYASTFRLIPNAGVVYSGAVDVSVTQATNYAGLSTEGEYAIHQDVSVLPKSLTVSVMESYSCGNDTYITVQVDPAECAYSLVVEALNSSPSICEIDESACCDANGTALFKMKTLLPGDAQIEFSVLNTDLSQATVIHVDDIVEQVSSVQSSVRDGSVITSDTKIALKTITDDADIYYSFSENGDYIKYEAPITLSESISFWVYATKPGYQDSDVVEYSYTVVNPLCSHSQTTTIAQVDPTCLSAGMTSYVVCDKCGEYLVEPTVIQALGHSFSLYESNHDATCTVDGTKTAKCDRCDAKDTVTDEGSRLSHTIIVNEELAPTCTENGLTEGSHCSVCGEVLMKQDIIPALGHADADHDGECDYCGKDMTENCNCICHQDGFLGFLYKLIRILWKIFGLNKNCVCGKAHY